MSALLISFHISYMLTNLFWQRGAVSQATINAPRRLLQFAVRDAVGTLRPSSLVKEPSMKRLRSVVSISTAESSLVDRPRRIQSIARVPNPMATVIKAVQEAAEDVVKVKSSRNVFDRLGREMDTTDQIRDISHDAVESEVYEEVNPNPDQTESFYLQRYAGHAGNIGIMESETGLVGDSMFDNEVYDDDDVMGHGVMDVSETGTSGGSKREDSLMVQYSVGRSADNDDMRTTRNKDRDQPVSAAKAVVNIPMNLNTWKPPHCQESRRFPEMGNWNSVQENKADTTKSGARLMKENNNIVMVGNGNAKPVADMHKESQKPLQSAPGSYATGRPLEDADSRTIFVSNVHFAATKDSLSRHFNKFGDVLKVVIMADAATGQPMGSAYIEFMRKEAADNALSLDGTSFMSRILKVVKRSPANQEATANMIWPRGGTRGSPYTAGRFSRGPFPRGISGAFRPRLPMKPGARSFQWKRDAQGTQAESTAPVSGSLVTSTARSLTYVRTEPKPDDGSSGAT
ncbi:poly-A binding protein, putative [Ricinus communis]|uniref:Poly-A binding protein, putative n=1 Tax=Ricinus communis TaxID=3988 RepID=B9RHF9_RICCO|nr:poly-A binding protein, putative [Ricinus communis]